MVCSDEPGLYIEGSHGIRTENQMFCKKAEKTEYGQFLEFEFLTYVPIDLEPLKVELMSDEDIAYLNEYHAQVYEKDRSPSERRGAGMATGSYQTGSPGVSGSERGSARVSDRESGRRSVWGVSEIVSGEALEEAAANMLGEAFEKAAANMLGEAFEKAAANVLGEAAQKAPEEGNEDVIEAGDQVSQGRSTIV